MQPALCNIYILAATAALVHLLDYNQLSGYRVISAVLMVGIKELRECCLNQYTCNYDSCGLGVPVFISDVQFGVALPCFGGSKSNLGCQQIFGVALLNF